MPEGPFSQLSGRRPNAQASFASLRGPSTQYFRTLVPKTLKGVVVEIRVLVYWVLGPSGLCV